jgi:hypothetical protein
MWSQLKSWWQSSVLLSGSGTPYEVVCRCGRVARGCRRRTHQVLRCRQCGAAVFILGRSPLPAVAGGGSAPGAVPPRKFTKISRRWLLVSATAVVAGVIALAVMVRSPAPAPLSEPASDGTTCRQHLAAGERNLTNGAFRQALQELAAARLAWQRPPQLLTAAEGKHLEQLWRQAAALVDLSSETLEEILHHASGTTDAEWLHEFAQRFQGKAFLLDTEIHALPGGHFQHAYDLRVQDEVAHLDLDNLELLRPLPLDPPCRVLLLARLGSIKREVGRGWVVQMVPDSGVLLTDAGAARICCPALGDAATGEILGRQKTWLLPGSGAGPK